MTEHLPRHRFLVDAELAEGSTVELTGQSAIQISKVLRMGPGDEVTLFNGHGFNVRSRILESGKRSVRLEVTGPSVPGIVLGAPEVHLLQATIKSDRFDLVVQKATELGVSAITAIETDHSVVKLSVDRAASRIERWRRIAAEALEQSERSDMVQIAEPKSFDQAIHATSAELRLIAAERSSTRYLPDVLEPDAKSIAIIVGPEGGFSSKEIERATAEGWTPVSLGPTILRSETAGIAAVAIIRALSRPS
jgi:16S rRNA (uracil1498-N3)-methyltransferase